VSDPAGRPPEPSASRPGGPPGTPLLLRRSLAPVRQGERDGVSLVLLDDLEDLSTRRLVVAEPLVALLFHLLDGTRDRGGVEQDWETITGGSIAPSALDGLLANLEQALLLEGPSVEAARREALAAYRARPSRPAAHAGTAYPADPEGLRARVREMRGQANAPAPGGAVHAVLAPHIDPRGGGPCHGAAIDALAASPASVFVVLGTAHQPLRRAFALTSQDFDVPTGRLPTDRGIVERLARRGGGGLLEDERQHGREHSVEFQAVWLHALHGARPDVRMVPMLVGSLHRRVMEGGSPMDDAPVRDMVEALRELRDELGSAVAFVASVDFAHVGPNYGWSEAPDASVLARVMEQDRRLLGHAVAGDAEGWMRFLQEEQDVRSVCGAAPTYVFLRAIEGWGLSARPLRHDLWEIDPSTGSHVSFASVAYVRPAGAA
jgi:AmmeMemoRadiSam system protein B